MGPGESNRGYLSNVATVLADLADKLDPKKLVEPRAMTSSPAHPQTRRGAYCSVPTPVALRS
jgi:hypothetical protein